VDLVAKEELARVDVGVVGEYESMKYGYNRQNKRKKREQYTAGEIVPRFR
jgi:hypothetical protein